VLYVVTFVLFPFVDSNKNDIFSPLFLPLEFSTF